MNFLIPGKKPELLPCPFCGEILEKVELQRNGELVSVYYEHHTPKSKCFLGRFTIHDDYSTWNTRTPKERGGEK